MRASSSVGLSARPLGLAGAEVVDERVHPDAATSSLRRR